MSLDSLSLALTRIQYLVNSLNKKNYLQFKNRYLQTYISQQHITVYLTFIFSISIEELVSAYGSEAEKHLLSCCLAGVDLSGTSTKDKDRDQHQLLAEYFGPRITQPGFPSLLSGVLDQSLRKSVNQQSKNNSVFVANLSRFLRLTRSQEVVLRIALLETFNPEARSQSLIAIRQKLCELFTNYARQDSNTAPLESGLQVSPELHLFSFYCVT